MALGMPFEVGKTLLQVEYRPRKRYTPVPSLDEKAVAEHWPAEDEVSRDGRVCVVIMSDFDSSRVASKMQTFTSQIDCRHLRHHSFRHPNPHIQRPSRAIYQTVSRLPLWPNVD